MLQGAKQKSYAISQEELGKKAKNKEERRQVFQKKLETILGKGISKELLNKVARIIPSG